MMQNKIRKILTVMLDINILTVDLLEKEELCVWVAGETVGVMSIPSRTGAINIYKLAQDSKTFFSKKVDLIQSGYGSNIDGAFCTVVEKACESEPVIFNTHTETEAIIDACAYIADKMLGNQYVGETNEALNIKLKEDDELPSKKLLSDVLGYQVDRFDYKNEGVFAKTIRVWKTPAQNVMPEVINICELADACREMMCRKYNHYIWTGNEKFSEKGEEYWCSIASFYGGSKLIFEASNINAAIFKACNSICNYF